MSTLCLNGSEVELLQAMSNQRVRFMVVGGHAVQFYGHVRTAKDLDLFYAADKENAARLSDALAAVRVSVPPEALAKATAQVKIGGWLNTELLGQIAGLAFDEAWRDVMTGIEQGIAVPVISLPHLLRSKRAMGRQQDLDDVAALERLHPDARDLGRS